MIRRKTGLYKWQQWCTMLPDGGWRPEETAFRLMEDISMSRWPMKEKFPRIATLLFIVLGCMILFQACSAN
jgi:hypothetical protein